MYQLRCRVRSPASLPGKSLDASRKTITGAVLAGRENPGQRSGQGRFVKRFIYAEPSEIEQPMVTDIFAHDSPPVLMRIISGVSLSRSSITFIITHFVRIVERNGSVILSNDRDGRNRLRSPRSRETFTTLIP